ncbi:MAG: beta strand repeat-containing protein [Prochlorothrix sp.]
MTVTNLGPTVATASATDPIIITDILPAGLSFQSATGAGWTCTSTEVTDTNSVVRDKVRCLRESNMAINTLSTLSINVFVDGDGASSITNTAYVDVAPADFTGDNAGLGADSATHPAETTGYATDETSTSRNIHSLTRPVTLSSDLSVTKVATSQTPQTNPPQFVNEATGTYTITVTNNGPSDFAGPVLVNEDLAASVLGSSISGATYTFKSFSGTGWACTDVGDANPCADGDTTLQFSRTGALAAGSSSSFTLDVNLSNATSPTEDTDNIDNTVTIDSATLTAANDAVSANNSATAIVDVESNTAVLTITKDDDDGSRDQDGDPSDDTRFVTGGEGSYFLIVTNNGPAAAQNVQIAENSGFTATNLPSGLTYKGYALTQNWRCTSSTATTFTCDYGQWTDTDNDGLVGEPGEDTFDDTVAMPAGTTSGLELIVSIDANATVGTLTNTVSANADNATQVTASEPTIIVEPANLAVTKTGVDTIDAVTNAEGSNTPATYTITVTNNGPGAAEGDIYLTDYLPDGLVYYSGAPQPTTNAALGDGTWTVISYNTISNQIAFRRSATLANGASSTIEVPVEVAANAPTIARNFVRVSSVTTPEPDYNTSTPDYDDPDDAPCDRDLDNYDGSGSLTTQPVNNCAVKATTITSGLETTLLKKQPATDDGTIDPVDISASGFNTLIPFTIEVTNPNTTTAVGNVIIQDTLPETLTYSSVTAISAADSDVTTAVAGREFTRSCRYASDTRVLTCNLGTVDASETVAITLEVTPNVSGIITNTAGYLSGGSNTDSESVNILNPPNANTLSGTVFEDAGANGGLYINGTDTPIQNITVNLYRDVNNDNGVDAGDILLASTASAADGTYSFETNLTGEFVVAVDTADPDLPSTTFTTPAADPRSYGVTLTAGANVANNDFGVAGGAAPSLDFGDAPDTYATLLASGGPRHTLSSTLYLGASQPDAETDGQLGGDAGAGADGDDTSGSDDEASVTPGILITNASSYSLDFTVHNTTGSNATLWGWIDFDQNGTFEADEVASTTVANGATTAQLTWATGATAGFNDLASATAGTTYGRFRLSRDAGITASTPGGAASDGEVEDYPITVTAPGSPNLLLVKRITRLLEKGSSSIVNYTSFVEDGSSSDDNDPNWPGHNSGDGSNTYTVGQTAIDASPGDRVEYTIYFLNTGSGVASNVKICDALSQYLTYIPNTYDAQSANADGGGTTNLGIELNTGGSSVYMTGLTTDAPDRGALVEAGVEPTGCVNPDLSAMTAGDNPKGTVTVDLGNVDASAGSGSPNTSYGYIRFQTIVD